MKKTTILLLLLVFASIRIINAQNSDAVKSLFIIDCPTAATLERGSFITALSAYENGGLLGEISVGISDRMMFGISYGGTNIIGVGAVNWNPQIAVNARYRIIDEELNFPAIAIGFQGQGRGAFLDSLDRYTEKSKGIYAAVSKSFNFLGFLAFHGGINYSFEREDKDKDLNGFVGLEKSINRELSLFAEYDLAMNDNSGRSIGDGKGYLHAGFKWTFQGKLHINFIWKNIFKNNILNKASSREIRLGYVEYF